MSAPRGRNKCFVLTFCLRGCMRVVIQRVSEASVTIGGQVVSRIGKGLLILLGVEHVDTEEDARWLVNKISQMRIFGDENGLMNVSAMDASAAYLVVSQFTLFASTKKGNRPSFVQAARPDVAVPLYAYFVAELAKCTGQPVGTGEFGADMQVSLVNDGPVTIVIDTQNKV